MGSSKLSAPIRTLIVEDEPLARHGISQYVDQVDFLEEIGQATDGIEALTLLQNAPAEIELLLLDVQMPGLTGTDLVDSLRRPPAVIFTTAHPGFAVRGFELEALDYLLKPITFPRFLKAVLKAKQKLRPDIATQPDRATTPPPEDSPPQEVFFRLENRIERVQVDRILYVESLQNYCRVVTTEGELLPLIPLKNVYAALPADRFFQTHRSYLVALAHIESLEGNQVRIAGQWLPVSRRRKDKLAERWLSGRLL